MEMLVSQKEIWGLEKYSEADSSHWMCQDQDSGPDLL